MRTQGPGYAGALLLVALCAGCSRFSVQSSYDPTASFHALRTYAWRPGPQPSIGDPRVNDALVDTTVRTAVDRDLTAKGYTKTSPDAADFLLAYGAGVDFKSSVVIINRSTVSSGGDWVGLRRIDTADFEQGTVVLTILTPQTAKPIWQGVAAGIFDPTATPEQRTQRITDALDKLLDKFPPR
jgi:hypothetical protein